MPSSTYYAVLLALVLGVGCGEGTAEKTCYWCKESVKADAIICKWCSKMPDDPTLKEKLIGQYRGTADFANLWGMGLRENGIAEYYFETSKDRADGGPSRIIKWRTKWKITKDGELHVEFNDLTRAKLSVPVQEMEEVEVYRINKDGSITQIAQIDKDGKRKDYPKEEQITYKKIN